MFLVGLVALSISLQLATCIVAMRLARRAGNRPAWSLVAIAFGLMAARRTASLAGMVGDVRHDASTVIAESMALAATIVLFFALRSLSGMLDTSRRQAEDLAASERKYRDLVETSNDLIWSVDHEGRWTFLNGNASRRIYGYEPEEMLGRRFADFMSPERARADIALFESIKAGARVLDYETEHIRRDGTGVRLRFNAIVLRDAEGRVTGTTGTATDITAQRDAERQQRELQRQLFESQKLESLGVLAGGVAHDFNNLLTAIGGNAHLALDHLPKDAEFREPILGIVSAVERATALTRQMLAYAGKGRFDVRAIDLSTEVREICPLALASVSKKIDLALDLATGLPAIAADDGQLHQVIMNLVINAAEAIGDLPGRVGVRTGVCDVNASDLVRFVGAESAAPGRFVWVEVQDNGCGMDATTKRRMFEPFFSTKFVGRGLGMAAVLGIVRGHRGAIAIDSEPGAGTTIRVHFPATTTASEVRTDPPPPPTRRGEGVILVVDDEDLLRQLAQTALERAGYAVVTAADGQAGVETFRRLAGTVRLVLLDLTMPRIDGEEAYLAMRAIDPEVRAILTSGYDEVEMRRHPGTRSMAGFLQKPYTPRQLVTAVQHVLGDEQSARGESTPVCATRIVQGGAAATESP